MTRPRLQARAPTAASQPQQNAASIPDGDIRHITTVGTTCQRMLQKIRTNKLFEVLGEGFAATDFDIKKSFINFCFFIALANQLRYNSRLS